MGGIMVKTSGDLWGMWDLNCVVGIGGATHHFWKSRNPYFLTIYPHLSKLSDNSPVFSILLKFKQSQKRLDNIVLFSFFIFLFFCFVILSILSYSVNKWITMWITFWCLFVEVIVATVCECTNNTNTLIIHLLYLYFTVISTVIFTLFICWFLLYVMLLCS